MEDFYVITKPVQTSNSTPNTLGIEYYQMDYLIQETFKTNIQSGIRFSEFEIDKSTLKLEVIGGQLCVVALAFRKKK